MGNCCKGTLREEPHALDMQETPSLWGLGLIFGAKPQTGEVLWENPKLAKHRKLPHLASPPVRATSSQCQKRMSLSQVGWQARARLSRRQRPRKNSNVTCHSSQPCSLGLNKNPLHNGPGAKGRRRQHWEPDQHLQLRAVKRGHSSRVGKRDPSSPQTKKLRPRARDPLFPG